MAKSIEQMVEAAMIERALRPEPWTYGEMFRVEVTVTRPELRDTFGRIADRVQQRWRRKGWATFTRIGRDTFWTLTSAGRAALSDTKEAPDAK